MKIDITSMFFNSSIEGKTATPAWGTSIGQNRSRDCRIDDFKSDVIEIIVGMTYCSIADIEHLDVSKGSAKRDIIQSAVFTDVFVNDKKLNDVQFVLVLVREHSASHEGRLLLSYAPYITYKNVQNQLCIDKMREALGCKTDGCWFVYDISIKNQSDLYFSAVVVNANSPMRYKSVTSRQRSDCWKALIPDKKESCKSLEVEPSVECKKFDSRDYAYMSAIKAKPFLILGGFSGTGKSLMVKSLAFATCPCDGVLNTSETSPGNYLLVSVKPNWHDATDITGFRSSVNRNYYVTDFMRFLVKAKLHPAVPFFVCLDEMNLAPVEEYFADFLSVIESRKRKKDGTIVTDAIVPASVFTDKDYDPSFDIFEKLGLEAIDRPAKVIPYSLDENVKVDKSYVCQDIVDELKREGLTIPQNVIIIGTVNMDDTTNSFSRKVIDRAMTFETVVNKFDVSYFDEDVALGYVEHPRKGELFISDEVRATEMIEEKRFLFSEEDKEKIIGFINEINADLEGTPFKISYRILNETILLYRAKQKIAEMMEKDGWEKGVEFNTALNRVFDDILMQKVLPRIEGDYDKCHAGLDALLDSAKKHECNQSAVKIDFMRKRFGNDKSGFTSFWN